MADWLIVWATHYVVHGLNPVRTLLSSRKWFFSVTLRLETQGVPAIEDWEGVGDTGLFEQFKFACACLATEKPLIYFDAGLL
jgi:hypothetical protein